MNDRKLKQLFETARGETPPVAPEGFDGRVVRALRKETRSAPVSFWDQLEALFPRLAITATLVVGLCVLGDVGFSTVYPGSLSSEVNAISEQWLFAVNGN